MYASRSQRYHTISIGLHWLTVVLLIAVYALIELREFYPRGSDIRNLMKTWHFMLGLSVLGVTLIRLPLRLLLHAPPITPRPPLWLNLLAAGGHVALYVLLLAMPILGWLTLSAEGTAVPFFGLELPALVATDHTAAENYEDLHKTIGTIGYLLIGLHALAALFHHYVMRDNTLRRMLPGKS